VSVQQRRAFLLGSAILYLSARGYRSLTPETKRAASRLVNRLFEAGERHGLVERSPGFRRDYLRDYPELEMLERHHASIRRECVALLGIKDHLTDVEALGGSYTAGGIHAIRWKSFVFKSGKFIEENCAVCPQTASLLRGIPGVYTAFFSILDPHQYVSPHWGYYKGFLRYHLGVVIPNDNEDSTCFLRVNDDVRDNAKHDTSLIKRGLKYYWREGQGVLFDDTFLHDAANDSDEVRIVLWLDVVRRMPRAFDLVNRAALWIAFRDSSVTQVRRNAVISAAPAAATARS
jgi:ornithine lipid ester-linked acyl 2-hydroxylase